MNVYEKTEAMSELYKLVYYSNDVEFCPIPHAIITDALYNCRHERHELFPKYFRSFVKLGYNPFRRGMSRGEKIQVKNIIAVIDKMEKRV